MKTILVTGATGTVGSEVVRASSEKYDDVKTVAALRDVSKAQFNSHIECREFDFKLPETFAETFKNVDAVFLMRPPNIADARVLQVAIDAMKNAGVRHVVFLSLLGVEKQPYMPHAKIEKLLRASGMTWTFLRASFFWQNLSTTHRDDIRLRDEIFVPAGHGKTSFVDVRDIGEVAALCLTSEEHSNRAYDITGDQPLDYFQVAREFSLVLNRRIRYANPSLLRFYWTLRRRKTPTSFIFVMCAIYTIARRGRAARVSDDTRRLLNRPATTARDFIERNRDLWKR